MNLSGPGSQDECDPCDVHSWFDNGIWKQGQVRKMDEEQELHGDGPKHDGMRLPITVHNLLR